MESNEIPTDIRLGIYVSGPDEDSLTAEEKLCRRVAAEILGSAPEHAQVWQDIVDERDADRAGRDAMLQAAGRAEFNCLVTPAPHRISRDLNEYIDIEKKLAGIRIVFADGCPGGSTEGNLTMQQAASYVELLQSQDRSKRHRRRIANTGRQGRAIPFGLRPPYGYEDDPVTKVRRVNRSEARILRRIFKMADKEMTLGQISEVLNGAGIKSRHGKLWISQILKNPSSAGIVQREGDESRHSNPIIDKATWLRVQDKLGTSPGGRALLHGLLTCGMCGNRMISISTEGHRFYRCRGTMPGIDTPRTCDAHAIKVQSLDDQVWGRLRQICDSPAGTTTEEEPRIAESYRRMALDIEDLGSNERRNLFKDLGIRVLVERSEEGISVTIRFDPPWAGTPITAA